MRNTIDLSEIKNGTFLVSKSHFGPRFVQVVDRETNQWGTHLVCVSLVDQCGEFQYVSSVWDQNTLGIGWRLPTESDLKTMARQIAHRNKSED